MKRLLPIVLAVMALASQAGWAQAHTPDDPLFGSQWGLQAIGVEDAWEYNMGSSGVKVAVIDDGVDYSIADFGDTSFDLRNAWDFYGNDSDVGPDLEDDHGTHVAAIIAQSTDNGTGAAGVAPGVTILPLKVFGIYDPDAEESPLVTQAVDHAVDAGADIICISIGAEEPDLADACQRAYSSGVLVVAAAGNGGGGGPGPPASFSSTLAVSAVNSGLSPSGYSQQAWNMAGPGMAGPGDGIVQVTQHGAVYYDGTSQAAAFVSGVAALIISEASRLGLIPSGGPSRVEFIKQVLADSAMDIGSGGPDTQTGHGLVQAGAAMELLHEMAP